MTTRPLIAMAMLFLLDPLPLQASEFRLITYADGRPDGGIRQSADTSESVDSPGDIFVFDQKLLAEHADTEI